MRKHKNLYAFTALLIVMMTGSCKKEERCSVHPDPFRFSIIDDQEGTDLIETGVFDIENTGIYYFDNDERQDLIINMVTEPLSQYIELKVIQLPMISLTGLSNIFYLELDHEVSDTLEIIVEKEAREDCDYHPYTMARHNGTDMSIVEGGVYLIRK